MEEQERTDKTESPQETAEQVANIKRLAQQPAYSVEKHNSSHALILFSYFILINKESIAWLPIDFLADHIILKEL